MAHDELDELLERAERLLGMDQERPFQSLRGRSTDKRQQAFYDDLSKLDEPDPDRWLIHFPDHTYPESREFRGTYPIGVAGHRDMGDEQFKHFIGTIHHSVFPVQAVEPAFMIESRPIVDIRQFLEGGSYEQIARRHIPRTHKRFEDIDSLVGNIIQNPTSHVHMRPYIVEDRVYESSSLLEDLVGIARRLLEPKSRHKTLGDVLRGIDYPFGTHGIV